MRAMKLERIKDNMLYHSSQVGEPDIKPPQHSGNTAISSGVKETNGSFCGLNDYENEADSLPFKLNNGDRLLKIPDLHCYTRGSSLRKESTDNVRDALGDTDFYTDKGVMECSLPELMVCYKESYNIDVKDICVDEGLQSADANFVENCKEGKMGWFGSSFSRKEDKVDIVLPVLEELKASYTNTGNNYVMNRETTNDVKQDVESPRETISGGEDKLGAADLSQNREVIRDSEDKIERCELRASIVNASDQNDESETENLVQNRVAIKYVKEQIKGVEVESVPEDVCGEREKLSTGHSNQTGEANKDLKLDLDSDVREKVGEENGSLQQDPGMANTSTKSSQYNDPVNKLSIQMLSGHKATTNSTLDSSREVSTNNSALADDLAYNSKVGTASITFHFDPSSPGASGRTETTPAEPRNSLVHEDDDASDRQKVASHVQRGDPGEASFATFSGLITYSGAIAYSGSLSQRSDTSATSAHSFAFPILPGEWNSSPIRMAKANRRRFRKYNRSWKKGILCCRF